MADYLHRAKDEAVDFAKGIAALGGGIAWWLGWTLIVGGTLSALGASDEAAAGFGAVLGAMLAIFAALHLLTVLSRRRTNSCSSPPPSR